MLPSGYKICTCGGWGTKWRLGRRVRPGDEVCPSCKGAGRVLATVNFHPPRPKLEEVMERETVRQKLVSPIWKSMAS